MTVPRLLLSCLRPLLPLTVRIGDGLARLNARLAREARGGGTGPLTDAVGAEEVRRRALGFVETMRVERAGGFAGYRLAPSATRPVLYATVAVLLLKHLLGERDGHTPREIDLLLGHQGEDGLFRDPAIASSLAEQEDWWGWRHLTPLALSALALHGVPARRPIGFLKRFKNPAALEAHVRSRDWGARAAWTSNEVQNLGVMLQYARDFQDDRRAADLLEVLYRCIEERQDPRTGLFGNDFSTPEALSHGVQAGYHFWLLSFYDRRPVPHAEQIVESVLRTQNRLGGYGTLWHSSACEDIDSIDPLVRLGPDSGRRTAVQESLRRALPALLQNLNADGGWVFRRHEAFRLGHPGMFSRANESNVFYTWFRMLGLVYCLRGLEEPPQGWGGLGRIGRAPGHQFLDEGERP